VGEVEAGLAPPARTLSVTYQTWSLLCG
jgi:hypothetical protein